MLLPHLLSYQQQLKRKSTFILKIYHLLKIFFYRHTKESLDEALDSVKSILMQTFKKNLESGGDLEYV
jgi:hypothetical protein